MIFDAVISSFCSHIRSQILLERLVAESGCRLASICPKYVYLSAIILHFSSYTLKTGGKCMCKVVGQTKMYSETALGVLREWVWLLHVSLCHCSRHLAISCMQGWLLLDLPIGGHWTATINWDILQIFCTSSSNCFTSLTFNVLTGIWKLKTRQARDSCSPQGPKCGQAMTAVEWAFVSRYRWQTNDIVQWDSGR